MRHFSFVAAAVLALLLPSAAHAAFPGANGEIAFSRVTSTVESVWAKTPGGAERQITQTAPTERSPAYSPDGGRIAYVSHQNGSGDIYVRNTDGTGDPINLTPENDASDDLDPSWSPDGKKIVFWSTRSSVVGLFVVTVATPGSAQRINGTKAIPMDPAWSPVGDQIAYHSSDGDNVDIWLIDADGTDSRNLTDDAMGRTNRDPAWSPDGARIAFSRVEFGTHIWTVDVATGAEEVQLTKEQTLNNRPAFSPDGTRVAWSRGGELWTMPADAHRPTEQVREALNVRNNAGVDWQPVPKGAEPEPTPTATATATAEPDKDGTGPDGPTILPPVLFEGGGPPAATCARSSVRFGDVEAIAACFSPKGKANVAKGRVRVNGLDIVPSGGTEIGIDPEQRRILSSGPVRVLAGTIPLYAGRLDWDLSRGRIEIPVDADVVKLIRIQGTATVTTDGLGRFRIAVLPRIDTIFERFAARLGAASGANLRLPAITGDAVLRTENARGLSLDSMSLTATSIPIGMLEVRALTLDFEPAAGNWAGTAKLKLPGPPPQVIADATVTVRDGALQQASLVAGNSLGTYGFGVRLERLALDMRTDPFRFGGELALGAGPSLPGFGQMVRVSGTVGFTAGTPSQLRLTGRSQIGPATGNATFTTSSTGRQDFAGDAALSIRPDIGLFATVKGTVQPTYFVVQGQARARLMGLELPGEGLVSNVGVAACVPVKVSGTVKNAQVFRVGFGLRLRPERLDLMSGSCDVAPWSPVPLGGKAGGSARATQGSPVAAFDLPDALPGMVLAIEGAGAPPSVSVTGPGGVRATTPAGGGEAGGVLFLRDVPGRTTYVAVPAPRAGRWALTLEPGSSAVTEVRRGDGLPAPRLTARVTGKGHRRTLHWTIRSIPGQVVRFAEAGRGAAAAITTTRKARGSARFAPADGPAGRRSIVAVVEQAGMARERIVAARYKAPAPQRPATPKRLTLKRRGSVLQVGWRRAAGATAYRVKADLSDGRRLLLTVRGRSMRIPAFGPRETAKVTVAGVRDPYEGGAASKRIKRR